ncbi:thymidylate kinase [Methanothermobacter marburgensis]|uniref:thymidylate kinase n=1 Tax=Methanothermobacter marburgensis TaxID=145263 RepID=UPI0035B72050
MLRGSCSLHNPRGNGCLRFIVIDGLDGAGKDTHAELIRKRYLERGERVIFRSHPEEDNPYGRRAKKALLMGGKVNHIKAAVFYALDVIRSLWKYHWRSNPGPDTLIFSRYLMGVAYLPGPLASILYRLLSRVLPTTEYMFFLDVSPEESLRRLRERDEHEMFENLEDLTKTREKALRLARGWYIINTEDPIADVQRRIDEILDLLDGDAAENYLPC